MAFKNLLPSLLLLSIIACSPSDSSSPKEIGTIETWYPVEINGIPFEVQLAINPSEQRKGLMFRENLGNNQGMLFPYSAPQTMRFWMANTKIPLDIGFFDSSGKLMEIHRMYPNDTTSTKSFSDNIQFALEMNQGWFKNNKIKIGSHLNKEQLNSALEKRGSPIRIK